MITFEKQNNIEVAAIDTFHSDVFPECLDCIFSIDGFECHVAVCNSEHREDKREVFFLSVYDKRILNYKNK